MTDLENIIREKLGVGFYENFLVKVPQVATWYKKDWLSVFIDENGQVRFSNDEDSPHQPHFKNTNIPDASCIVSFNGLDVRDEDFFWRVTLGNLLAGTLEIKKVVPVTIQTTVDFLKMQKIEYIKTVQDGESIAFSLGDKNANFTEAVRKDNMLLYKPIKEIYKYICRDCEKYNVLISLSELKEIFVMKI